MIDLTLTKNITHNSHKLPLFDIDGTLVQGGNKIHAQAFDYVFESVFHVPEASSSEIIGHGMIDTQIIIEVLLRHGVSEDRIKAKIKDAVQEMANYFEEHKVNENVVLLPGVEQLLQKLHGMNVPIGLLTGNVEEIGWAKMDNGRIKKYFSYGGFGNLAYNRFELISIAKERLELKLGTQISLNRFVIIGDTPLDIACAKKGGISCIAVATGNYSVKTLREADADLVVDTLEDHKRILQFLGAN